MTTLAPNSAPRPSMDSQSSINTVDRSTSRGRGFESSGRGGAGNIGRLQSPDARPSDGPDDFSVTRGREPIPANQFGRAVSSGRGGAGNIRAPSNSRDRASHEYDAERVRAIDEANESGIRAVGRGGIGNIFRSPERSQERSSSRSRGHVVHSTGRGGAGNLKTGEPTEVTIHEVEDQERLASPHRNESGMHSTGRGGFANIKSDSEAPPVHEAAIGGGHPHEHHSHEMQSTGRGGAGNIRATSQDRGSQQGKVSTFFHNLTGKNNNDHPSHNDEQK